MGVQEHAMPKSSSLEFAAFSRLAILVDEIEGVEQDTMGRIVQEICEKVLQLKSAEDRQRYLVLIQGAINKTEHLTQPQKSFFSQQVSLISGHLHRIP